MSTPDDFAARQHRIAASLTKLESRIEMIHNELRETSSTVTRLKLMADNAKTREMNYASSFAGLVETISRMENILLGRTSYDLDDQEPEDGV